MEKFKLNASRLRQLLSKLYALPDPEELACSIIANFRLWQETSLKLQRSQLGYLKKIYIRFTAVAAVKPASFTGRCLPVMLIQNPGAALAFESAAEAKDQGLIAHPAISVRATKGGICSEKELIACEIMPE